MACVDFASACDGVEARGSSSELAISTGVMWVTLVKGSEDWVIAEAGSDSGGSFASVISLLGMRAWQDPARFKDNAFSFSCSMSMICTPKAAAGLSIL